MLAVVDGLHGFGQTVTPQAVAIGIDKCKAMGLSMVALRNAGHIGRVGDWAEMAAEAGLVSVHFVNASGSVLVAPFGGTERRLSTAPFCVGVPRPGEPPVVLDFATSVVAEGKVLVASQGGKKLPDDALIEPRRQDERRPARALRRLHRDGPAPGRQGHGRHPRLRRPQGLGARADVRAARRLADRHEGHGRGASRDRFRGNGMLSFYVDPAVVDPEGLFPEDVARYVAYFKSAKPVAPGGEVLHPGEPENRTRRQRLAEGMPLPDDTWAAIVAAAREVGVDERRIQQAGAA